MKTISVPGPISGRSYSVTIGGDEPTADDRQFIDAYVREQETAFAGQYQERFGEDLMPSRGVGAQIGEFFRGIPSGAGGLLETAALGLSTPFGEETEGRLREGIRGIGMNLQDRFAPEIGREDTVGGRLGQAVGSMGAIAGAGLAGSLVGGPLAGLGVAGTLGAAAGAGEASERARAADATLEERNLAARLGVLPGVAELVPLVRLNRVLERGGFRERLTRALIAGGEEGVQEAASSIAQNLIEQGVYNPERGAFEGTGEDLGYGAGAGALIQAISDLVIPGRLRSRVPPPATSPAPDVEPGAPATTAAPVLAPDQEQGELFSDLADVVAPPPQSPAQGVLDLPEPAYRGRQGEFDLSVALPGTQADMFREGLSVAEPSAPVAPAATTEPSAPVTPAAEPAPTTTNFEALLDELEIPRSAAVRKAVKSGAVKTDEDLRARLGKFAAATTSDRATRVNEYLQREATPAVEPEAAPAVAEAAPEPQQEVDVQTAAQELQREAAAEVPTQETQDAQVTPSGPVEPDLARGGDGTPSGIGGLGVGPVAGEPDTTGAEAPVGGAVGEPVLGAPEPSVAAGPQPDALTPEAPALAVPETVISPEAASVAYDPMTGAIPGAETGAAGQVIPAPIAPVAAPPAAPDQTPVQNVVDQIRAQRDTVVEQDAKVAAQADIETWYATNASPEKQAAHARIVGAGIAPSPMPAGDMQKVVDLLRRAPKPRAKGKITPEQAAFTYFSMSPDMDLTLRTIAYDQAQNMETDPATREAAFRRATEFDDPAEGALYAGTGREAALRAARWVRENLSEPTRQIVARHTFNEYRPIDYEAAAEARDVRRGQNKMREAEIDEIIRTTYGDGVADTDTAADLGFATEDLRGYDLSDFSPAGIMQWPNRAHPQVEAQLRAGDVRGALQGLALTAPNRTHRRVAQKLLARIGGTRSQVVSPDVMNSIRAELSPETSTLGVETPAGVYVHPRNEAQLEAMRREGHNEAADLIEQYGGQILFNETTNISPELALHEAVHAVADGVLTNKSHPLTRQLDKLRAELLKYMPATTYGLTNVREMLAEGLNNPVFRRDLSYANVEGQPYSAWQRFKNIMGDWLRGLIGLQPKKRDTAADAVDRALDAVLAINPNEMAAGDIVGASFAPGGAREVLKDMASRVRTPTKADLQQTSRVLQDTTIPSGWKGTLMRLAMPLDYVADAASKYFPSARRVHDMIMQHQAEIQRVSSIVSQTTESIAKNLSGYKRDQQVIDNFNRVLFQGTLNEVDVRKPRSAYEGHSFRHNVLDSEGNVIRTVESKRYATETERNKALQDFNAKLPANAPRAARARRSFDTDPEQLQAYDRLRPLYDALPAEVKSGVGRSFEMPVALGKELTQAIRARLDALLPNQKALQDKVYGIVYEKILAGQLIDPYQPLRRVGEFWLSYEALDADTGRTEVFKHSFNTEGQRAAAIRMLEAAPADQQIRNVEPYQNVGSMKARTRVPMEFVARVLDTIDGSDTMDASVKGQVIELMFDTLPETSFVNSFRRRANIRGFTADFTPITEGLTAGDTIKNLRESSMRIARQAADLKYGAEFSSARTNLEREFNEFQARVDPSLTSMQRARQNAEAQQYHDLLSDYTTVPFRQRSAISRTLTGGAYMLTLGFNASTALITLSQVPLFVTPFLAGRYGMRNTVSALGEANRVLAASGRERTVERIGEDGQVERVRVPVRIWDYSLDNYDFSVPENAYLEPLHSIAKKNGVFNRSLLQDELLGEQPTMTQRIAASTGIMQHHAERYSRETALMSAYLLDLQQQMGDTGSLSDFTTALKSGTITPTAAQTAAAAETAVNTSEKTNGPIYAAAGPMASQNDIGAVMYLFKRHPLSMLNLIGQTAIRANPFGTNDPADRKIAQRQFGGMMGMMGLMSGALGMPLMQQVGMLYDLLFADDDEPDFETVVRTTLGEAGSFGLVDFLTGTRISERIGLGGAIYRPGFASEKLPLPYQILEGVGGPVLGLGLKYTDRLPKLMADGEYQRALEAALPSAFANVARAVRFGDEGIRTMRYDPIVDDIGPASIAAQALGFMPAEYAQRLAMNSVGSRINNAIDTKRTKLLRQRYVAIRKGDVARVQEIDAEIGEFNQRHPANAITGKTIRDSLRSHQQTTARTHHGVSYSPRNEAYIRDLTEQFGPASLWK